MISSIPEEIRLALKHWGRCIDFSAAHGGCINNGGILETSTEKIFIKWNSRQRFPGMLAAEAFGLKCLAEHCEIRIPAIRDMVETESYQVLLLEPISEKGKSSDYWSRLGLGLAKLHNQHDTTFGLDADNYIGSLPQNNGRVDSLVSFYIDKRFEPQIALANKSNLLETSLLKGFDKLFSKLKDILPERKPSLLHGDLWSGNIMCDEKGQPVLIDPAIYYGAPEADLAMTQLFGGFDQEFYEAYFSEAPPDSSIEDQIMIYQLYPLLVHVNLFGRSYVSQVRQILSRFT